MNWYKKSSTFLAYHGTSHDFNIFDSSFVGQGNDQEGPGFYFSDNPDIANGYAFGKGANVKPVKLQMDKAIRPGTKINQEEIEYLILKSMDLNSIEDIYNMDEDTFYNSPLSNWSEDPYVSFQESVQSVINYSEDAHDAFQSVWYDFYRNNPSGYLSNMISLGYDGVILPQSDNSNIFVVFNPSKITSVFS